MSTIDSISVQNTKCPIQSNTCLMELTKSLKPQFAIHHKQWIPSDFPTQITPLKLHFKKPDPVTKNKTPLPTMSDIMDASKAQNLEIQLQTVGPFFRITAKSLETKMELGRAEGLIRLWFGGKVLHLDSMKMKRETLGMEKSVYGIGLFIGAVAIRHGFENGCCKAELLAINDTDLYHTKLVKFYTRLGFKQVYEVTGSSIGDMSHMLVWGGVGTRMDAGIDDLMIKWCSRFTNRRREK